MLLMAVGAFAAPEGMIAYVAGSEQEDQRVHVLDCATEERRPIGRGQRDGAPAWSPNGQRIAFMSQVEGGAGVFIADLAGDVQELDTAHEWNGDPRWSTDGCKKMICDAKICGRYLLYIGKDGIGGQIMVYDLASGEEEAWAGGRGGMLNPVWLPSIYLTRALEPDSIARAAREAAALEGIESDGGALTTELSETGGILALRRYGRTLEIELVTRTQAMPLLPLLIDDSRRYTEWNVRPDRRGRQIAFESNDGGDREIFVLHRKGLTNVTNHRSADWNPAWSSAGDWLAFESFRGGRRGIYKVFADTALVHPLAADPRWSAWSPAWSPDDGWIAFVSDMSGDPELYVMNEEGEELRRLSNKPGPDFAPSWRPEVNE